MYLREIDYPVVRNYEIIIFTLIYWTTSIEHVCVNYL